MIYFKYVFYFAGLVNLIGAQDNLGIVYGEGITDDVTNSESFCLMYNPSFSTLPDSLLNADFHDVGNFSTMHLCNDTTEDPGLYNTVAFVKRGNCSFSEKAVVVQKFGAKALVVISFNGLHEPVGSDEEYDKINISVSLINEEDFNKLMTLGKDVKVKVFSPPNPRIDWNMVVIWLLATGTVIAGAFWSGIAKHKKYLSRTRGLAKRRSRGAVEDDADDSDQDIDPDSFDLNPTTIIVFVVLMCGMLISLYFFYDYLVYIVISMFTFAASTSLYSCILPLWMRIPCFGTCRLPPNKLPILRHRPQVRQIALFLLCAGVAVWWAVERNKSYAWILQDILGVVFCINMMKTVRLPSLMSCSILLSLLFVYDIFFVFVTPLFTKSGQSIMVDVATGGGSKSGEMLPMVLKVPRITVSALTVCQLPYSLLGFGDILVPGLLVSYCHGFDLKVGSKRIYFISSVIAYGVGLVLTFIALALMNQGQPALLYLVPCTLLTTFLIGACRQEFHHMWTGKLSKKKVSCSDTPGTDQDGVTTEGPAAPGDSVDNNSDASDSDQPLLINK